jgi:CRISPR/Cas system-associated exonuclease Cas4 (RecB family)
LAIDAPNESLRANVDAAVAEGFAATRSVDETERVPPSAGIAEIEKRAIVEIPQEPLPARMLNEFVYCPRLFYYEFVEGVFVHNADTMRGAAIHTRVDSGSGAMPPAESDISNLKSEIENEVIHSRSVSLGSERLGVTAKIDLVEVRAGQADDAESDQPDLFSKVEVCPVDYKAGAPREGDEGKSEPDWPQLWDADKMQLGLQCLLLRDNGYACNEGIIYYRATKQRVRLVITPEVEAWVLQKSERRVSAPLDPSRHHSLIRQSARAAHLSPSVCLTKRGCWRNERLWAKATNHFLLPGTLPPVNPAGSSPPATIRARFISTRPVSLSDAAARCCK